jgi:hypothetical protein
MARRKIPENETPEETLIRQQLETVASNATRSEKTSWNRKMDNMVKLIAVLRPIEEQILDLMAQKMPVIDSVTVLRAQMVKECIHPIDSLVYKDDHIACKFCEKRIGIPNDTKEA